MQRTFPHMQLSLIHFSSNEVCYCSCSREATLSCCVYCGSPNCRIYIGNTQKNTFVVRGYRVHISEKWLWHRPQSPTGLFAAPFGGSAQRLAVGCYEPPFLRNCAQGPCRAHSVSQPLWLFHCATAMAGKERRGTSWSPWWLHSADRWTRRQEHVCGHESKHRVHLPAALHGEERAEGFTCWRPWGESESGAGGNKPW